MNYLVQDFMSNSSAYVCVNSRLNEVLSKMFELNLKKMTVVDDNNIIVAIIGRKDLFKHVSSKQDLHKLTELTVADVLDPYNFSIIAYPKNDICEVFPIMQSLEIQNLPVAASPWNKKLIGFISLKEIDSLIIDNYSIA